MALMSRFVVSPTPTPEWKSTLASDDHLTNVYPASTDDSHLAPRSGINQQWALYVGDAAGCISVFQHRNTGAGEGAITSSSAPPDMKDLVLHQAWSHLHR